jgi:RNA polymerase sigma-70 factor (ECF subfamily)
VSQQQQTEGIDVEAALEKHANTVYRIALAQTRNRDDAQDVFQEVFLRLVRSQKKISSEEHLKAWLIRVTVNCCKTHFANAFRRRTVDLSDEIPYIPPEELGVLQEVLSLPEKYRAIIHLFYFEDLSVNDIAQTLRMKSSTVKSHLFRARNMLREKLKGGDMFDEPSIQKSDAAN